MDDRVFLKDVVNAGYCVRGARAWFKSHDLNFREFIRTGLPRQEFLDTGCHLAEDIVKKKDERNNG